MDQEASNAKKDTAYHAFKRNIIDFTFPPGALLTEEFLAEKFKISRTPIRDAILKLQQDGLVERASKGVQVKRFTLAEVIDTYLVREALEKCAVRLCVERADAADLVSIRESVESYVHIDTNAESYFSLNEKFIDFHSQLVKCSNNNLLLSQYGGIVDRIRIINRMHMNQSLSINDVMIRHLNIIDAVIDRNAFLAEALINSSFKRIIKHLEVSIE
ncbi:GntR family transcriptional regulator [Aminobacter sp. LjRoot7]|uniref:GntR family transcriptional regulator n=1 Tax=Aminobacter sp. LjRoot7 TaxID=3342335 RepID=UPI003ED06206